MRARTPALTLGLLLASAGLLVGCTPAPAAPASPAPADASSAPAAGSDPEPELTPNPAEPDSILWVRATATASNGAELSLEAMLHRSVSYAYPGSQTMNQIIIDDCGATLTNAILTADAWSISRMNVTAIPPKDSAEWPADARIGFRPSAANAPEASRGVIQPDAATGDLACRQDKFLAGSGRGAIAVGIPHDTLGLDSFNNGWARHTWGFTAPAGVTLSDCSFETTDLGRQFGGDAADWTKVSDAANCYIGPATDLAIL